MDASIVAAARSGDSQALDVLVRAYHERVYRFGLKSCRDAFDADDAVQEAFIKLARRPDVARDPSVLSWLMTVVRHACARMLRPFARDRRLLGEPIAEPDEVHAHDADPEAAIERWRVVHAVHEGIAALDPLYREVIILRDLEGLTGAEVCDALGIEESAMKSRLHRARKMLRDALTRRGVIDDGRSA